MRIRGAAIEATHGPRGAAELGIEPDNDHAPGAVAIRQAAQSGGDHVFDLVLLLGILFMGGASYLAIAFDHFERQSNRPQAADLGAAFD